MARDLYQYVYIEEGERLEDTLLRAYNAQRDFQAIVIVRCGLCQREIYHQYNGGSKCGCTKYLK